MIRRKMHRFGAVRRLVLTMLFAAKLAILLLLALATAPLSKRKLTLCCTHPNNKFDKCFLRDLTVLRCTP